MFILGGKKDTGIETFPPIQRASKEASDKKCHHHRAFSSYQLYFGKKASCRYEPIEFLERGQHFRRSVDRASLKK